MSKYLNIILISFFGVYLIKYDSKLTLYFPIVFFYLYNNKKGAWLIIPCFIVSLFLLNEVNISIILLMLILVVYAMFVNKKRIYVNMLFIFIINFVSLVIFKNQYDLKEIAISGIYSLISSIIYIFLEVNFDETILKHPRFSLCELITSSITILASLSIEKINVYVAFIIAVFYAMYYSKNKYVFESIIHNGFCLIVLTQTFESAISQSAAYIIVLISVIYLLPKLYPIIVVFVCSFVLIYFDLYNVNKIYLILVMATSLFFEVFKPLFIFSYNKNEFYESIYSKQMSKVNGDLISYATFLDSFSKKYSDNKEYKNALDEAINSLVNNYCIRCYKKNECFKKNYGKLYYMFKDLILYYDHSKESALDTFCPTIVEMRKSSMLLNQKLNISKVYSQKNSLITELNAVSTILRQFTIDKSMVDEVKYISCEEFRKNLLQFGLNLTYFNPVNLNKDDLCIELAFRNQTYQEVKEYCERAGKKSFEFDVSAVFKEASITKTYITIVPKILIDVTFGYAKMSEETNDICGDNYLIKQLNNQRLISVICDGMGKGVNANSQSNEMIKMVEEIVKMPTTTLTSIQMLNTICGLEEYLEKYSTLDFLEINRSKSIAIFYKMGSSSSYVLKEEGKLIKVENSSLPFGLEDMVETKEVKLDNNDIIIMSSDGIIDNIIEENDFKKFIQKLSHLTSQKMAYEIITYAAKCDVKASDDKCVIVLKVNAVN